jgi:hypothetical protein
LELQKSNNSNNESIVQAEKLRILARNLLDDISIIRVYFRELGIVKYSRDELYGITDAIGKLQT